MTQSVTESRKRSRLRAKVEWVFAIGIVGYAIVVALQLTNALVYTSGCLVDERTKLQQVAARVLLVPPEEGARTNILENAFGSGGQLKSRMKNARYTLLDDGTGGWTLSLYYDVTQRRLFGLDERRVLVLMQVESRSSDRVTCFKSRL